MATTTHNESVSEKQIIQLYKINSLEAEIWHWYLVSHERSYCYVTSSRYSPAKFVYTCISNKSVRSVDCACRSDELFTWFRIEFHSGIKLKSTRVYMENVCWDWNARENQRPGLTPPTYILFLKSTDCCPIKFEQWGPLYLWLHDISTRCTASRLHGCWSPYFVVSSMDSRVNLIFFLLSFCCGCLLGPHVVKPEMTMAINNILLILAALILSEISALCA